ncbi:MAG: Protein arginine N-methyltransferase 1 [Labilithrix sp.]|nr:Protein arginine N-methyltransferase 1 [Labilithrix sp.]
MYTVLDYGRMAGDGVRMDAYARAIARVVTPGCTVLDLGAGTGIMSLLAARAGARRVHACEINPAVLLLRDLARENGCADRIEVHHCELADLALPERVDVIVSDLRGNTPLNGAHLEAIAEARRRFLVPGGTLVPLRDTLYVQLVESEALARRLDAGLRSFEMRGLRASALRPSLVNSIYDDRAAPIEASDVLSTEGAWATIDYAVDPPSSFEGTVDLEVTRAGDAHGLVVWFEAHVTDDIRYRTAPGWSLAYARAFLPLAEPLRVACDERLKVTVRADARGDRWAWDTELAGGRVTQRQSTFLGAPTDPAELLRLSSSHQPVLGARGSRARAVLEAIDGKRTVEELTRVAGGVDGAPGHARLLEETRELVSRYAR